jgi:hypothetical protein
MPTPLLSVKVQSVRVILLVGPLAMPPPTPELFSERLLLMSTTVPLAQGGAGRTDFLRFAIADAADAGAVSEDVTILERQDAPVVANAAPRKLAALPERVLWMSVTVPPSL